jgi:DNA-binding MarR family transcriptional regulator
MKRSNPMAEDFTPEELAAWTQFVAAATQVVGALDTDMKAAFGIGHFDHALLIGLLRSSRRQARMSDLAWMLRLAPSNITHRVGRLEKRGLLVRRADPHDGRVVLARITPEGLRLLRDAQPVMAEGVRRYFLDPIDPERLGSVAETFTAIVDSKGLNRPTA